MKVAYITLSEEGARLFPAIQKQWPECDFFLHTFVSGYESAKTFDRVADLTTEIFAQYNALIYALPTGVVVRSIAPHVVSKLSDPAVVVLDVAARWAISLLSGHEGGANIVAQQVANLFDGEAIVTTTTEARKDLILGIGCRRGTSKEQILSAIDQALAMANLPLAQVRLIASVTIKSDEVGLLAAAEELQIPTAFLSPDALARCERIVNGSEFVKKTIGVPAVCEPAALLAGRRTSLLLSKTAFNGVTVAIAKESSTSLA